MPLARIENINSFSTWTLWHIEESEACLVQLLATQVPDTEPESISHPQKRLEWAAGRLALKAAVEARGVAYKGIIKDIHNRPYLIDDQLHISITHSFPYAAAIVSNYARVGIDIEKPREKLLKVASRFLNAEEAVVCGNNVQQLCVYWCAKEALYKKYGDKHLIFNQQIHIKDTKPNINELLGIIYADSGVCYTKMIHHFIDGHVVCYNID